MKTGKQKLIGVGIAKVKKNRKNRYKVIAGILGGSVVSKAKAKAAKLNGKKGGRPRKVVSEEIA